MSIKPDTKILDLGGGTGAHIAMMLNGRAATVTVADILCRDLEKASSEYGFELGEIGAEWEPAVSG